jgi:RHS repeat-associated protein
VIDAAEWIGPADDLNLQGGEVRVQFGYDYLGRRVWKAVSVWDLTLNGGAGDWSDDPAVGAYVRKFVWGGSGGTGGSSASGWLMLLELEETGVPPVDTVMRKYTWGLDLAGLNGASSAGPPSPALLEGAGTIGGLLAMEGPLQIRGELNYVYFYDGNGNVGQLVEWPPDLTNPPGTWSAARLVAHYEYDPYGNITAQSGTYADSNPIRFSTKYFDAETGLYYFGHRYYSPDLGRWINRDPIGEGAGAHLWQPRLSFGRRHDDFER